MKPASQVLPAQKAPLSPHSPLETQAPILPSPTPSRPKALALSPSLFQMWQHLAKAEAKLHTPDSGGHRELSESEYTDVLDRSCSQTWQDYGVREVNQVKRLTGPGLSNGQEPSISVMITGGPWPTRLSVMCLHYLGEFGEDQIYEAHQQGQGALKALLCEGFQGPCSEEAPVTRAEL